MIDEIIHSRLDALRRAKVNPIGLAHRFDLFPCTGQADDTIVEFFEVGLEHRGGVARGVAGYEEREQGSKVRGRRGASSGRSADEVNHLSHFVEFFWAYVGAVSETEIDLLRGVRVSKCIGLVIVVCNSEPGAYLGLAWVIGLCASYRDLRRLLLPEL